jgi:hypothetical protein
MLKDTQARGGAACFNVTRTVDTASSADAWRNPAEGSPQRPPPRPHSRVHHNLPADATFDTGISWFRETSREGSVEGMSFRTVGDRVRRARCAAASTLTRGAVLSP